MTGLRKMPTAEQKTTYLKILWDKTYLDDVVDRHHVENREALEAIADALCSSVGSLTNTTRITNTLESVRKIKISDDTVAKYIRYLEEAFLFNEARRYNIKGNKYYENIKKYYAVDVGVVEHRAMVDGKSEYRQYEVDFIATDGNEKYYIQSAYEIEDEAKRKQELNSLKRIDDSFQKIVIVKDDIMPYRDNNGIFFTGLFQFLMNDKLI